MKGVSAVAFASLLALLGCTSSKGDQQGPPGGGGGGAPPPGEVGIVTLKTEQVTIQNELSGRTAASLTSDVRPQVSGIVKQRNFEEGAKVTVGQLLYVIDASMYRAGLDQASADLASARASLESAKARNERYAKLGEIEGVSKQEVDDARAAFNGATAGVAQRQAALAAARLNLDYTQIRAPITGRIGKSLVTVGALVTANQPQPLATIRSLDPIYVDLTESSEDRLRLRAALGAGTLKAGNTKVKLVLGDGSVYDKEGVLEFAEVAVDEATGTVTLRAKFPNPDDVLLPGMYVRAQLDQAIAQDAILAPQQGITHDAKGAPVAMVVGANGTVEMRELVADRAIGDRWLVTKGLAAGDKLIVEGLNKIGPGMPVHATEVALGAPGAPPTGVPQAGSASGSAAPATGSGNAVAKPAEAPAPAAGSGSGSGSNNARK